MMAGTLIIDGVRLETAWWGRLPADVPTLVLLHEGLGSVGLWRDFPERLAAATGCSVFAYSRQGYGKSDPAALPRPMTYMHDEAQQVLGRVLDAACVGRCILVGHSDGGSIAAIYAGSVQDFRVRGLVLMAPHFFVEDVSIASIAAAGDAYDSGSLRERLARHHAHVDSAFRGWNDAWLDPRFREFDLTGEVAHIRVPLLLLQGADDPYGTAGQLEFARREAYCPVEIRLIAQTGHAPHQEATETTIEAIAAFTDRLLRQHENAL